MDSCGIHCEVESGRLFQQQDLCCVYIYIWEKSGKSTENI